MILLSTVVLIIRLWFACVVDSTVVSTFVIRHTDLFVKLFSRPSGGIGRLVGLTVRSVFATVRQARLRFVERVSGFARF